MRAVWLIPVIASILILGTLVLSQNALADTISVTHNQITNSVNLDFLPTLGADGVGNVVVYTSLPEGPSGFVEGLILYQRLLADGSADGSPVVVSDVQVLTDDRLNDVSGNQFLNNVFGNLMSYADAGAQVDVFVSSFEFIADGPCADNGGDSDDDGICDDVDNCSDVANADQADGDGDGAGDVCDGCPNDAANDADGDGVCGDIDNCPGAANAGQADGDVDGLGDACDPCPLDPANDADGDGLCADVDPCPDDASNTCGACLSDADCNDNVSCTVDACVGSSCSNAPNDALCDDGLFCNGTETCDLTQDCQAGTAPNTDDGVGCTDDSCDEPTDTIVNTANDANCDDGAFCNGLETCDAALGCQDGTPVECGDGISCTLDTCNEATDTCDNTTDDNLCPVTSCTVGVCVAGTGCEVSNVDDGIVCEDTGVCLAGVCTFDEPEEPEKVKVCHKGKKTITISENAVPAHEDHGDELGECGDDSKKLKKVKKPKKK